ncbi:MAG: hypothetical protein U1E52_06070 [Geminicoccaceae bacterium]
MDAEQHHLLAGAQPHPRAQRGDPRLQQEAQLGRHQLEPREQGEAVGVVERMQHPVLVPGQQLRQPLDPPGVGLQRQHQVGVAGPDAGGETGTLAIVHQHVDHEQAQASLRLAAGPLALGRPERRVGQDMAELPGHGRHQQP